jgi:hypothetical protein
MVEMLFKEERRKERACAASFLHSGKIQLFSFRPLPHSLPKNTGGHILQAKTVCLSPRFVNSMALPRRSHPCLVLR